MKIYLGLDDETCLKRRLDRDTRERGRTPDSVAQMYRESVRPMQSRYVFPMASYADLLLDGRGSVEGTAKLIVEALRGGVALA